MPTLRLERPPQYILTIGAEVFDLQFRSQDLLCKSWLVEIQRTRRGVVCCCHVNEKFWLDLQSLEINTFSLWITSGWWQAFTSTVCYTGSQTPSAQRCHQELASTR